MRCLLYSHLKKNFIKKHNYNAHFVGHPLLDAISNLKEININEFKQEHNLNEKTNNCSITRVKKARNRENAKHNAICEAPFP